MLSGENEILNLGDYGRFNFEDCVRTKFDTSVLDEGGLSSPLAISVVIPTKFEPDDIQEIEEETLHRILSECSKLVDRGYLDEIVIMGATRKRGGNPDYSILQDAVRIAYEDLGLFKEQVDLLNRYRSQNERAKRGLTDFFLKVVHQYDRNISRLLARHGVFGTTGYFGISPGKGSAIWLSIPITRGDVICFVDADIVNFDRGFITGLCHPIIYSWKAQESAIKFVKSYYERLTLTGDKIILGGRVCRFLATPLLETIVEVFNLYRGLDDIKYPLAGEYAISRDTIEQLTFPTSYAIEMSILFQIYDLMGPSSIAQLDLGTYRHIGQKFEGLKSMSFEIVDFTMRVMNEKLGRPLTSQERNEIMAYYEERVNILTNEYSRIALRLREKEKDLIFSKKEDTQKARMLKEVLNDILSRKSRIKRSQSVNCPSWRRIGERIDDYFVLRELLRRRSNQSTWSRLKECNLLQD